MAADAWFWIKAGAGAFAALLAIIALWRNREPADPHAAHRLQRVREYRERHGVGLREALEAIQAQDAGQPLPLPAATQAAAAGLGVETLARQGRVIEAIKLYRQQTGASLSEAKRAVDQLRKG